MLIALLVGLLLAVITGIIIMSTSTLTGIYQINDALLNIDFVSEIFAYTRVIAISILVLVLMVKGINQWQLYRSGDPSASPKKMIINAVVAVVGIFGSLEIIRLFLQLSNAILRDLAGPDMMFGSMMGYTSVLPALLMNAEMPGDLQIDITTSIMMDVIFKLIFSVGVFIIIYQVAYRTLELVGLSIIAPFFCVGLVTDSRDLFTGWVKTVAGVAFGHVFQYCLMLFLFFSVGELDKVILVNKGDVTGIIFSAVIRVAALLYVIRSPKHMQKLLFSGGSGEGGGGGVLSKAFYMRSIVSSGKSPK